MDQSHIARVAANRSTCLPEQFRELPLDVLGLKHAYEMAKALHATRPLAPGLAGYRVFCIFRDNVSAIDLPARDDAYLIVGRHTRCDVVLDAEPTIALRHLLVRASILPDGTGAIRIMDLQTTLAFHVGDGGHCRSIFAVGPIAVRLGPYALVALPLDPTPLPPSLPRPTLTRALAAPSVSPQGPYREPGVREEGRVFKSSHITILPATPLLEDLPPAPEGAREGYGRLALDRGFRMAQIEIPETELDAGILIGRALKCKDAGLRAVLDNSTSRAHLLLIKDQGQTTAFDLASTQGTFVNGARVRRYVLADRGASLVLGHTEPVRLTWHRGR